jgi:hypothetical protein
MTSSSEDGTRGHQNKGRQGGSAGEKGEKKNLTDEPEMHDIL